MSGHKGNGPTFNVAKVAKERHDIEEVEEAAIEQYQPPLCIEELRAIPDGPRIKKLHEALSQALRKAFGKIPPKEFVKCLKQLNVTEDSLIDLLDQLQQQVVSCSENELVVICKERNTRERLNLLDHVITEIQQLRSAGLPLPQSLDQLVPVDPDLIINRAMLEAKKGHLEQLEEQLAALQDRKQDLIRTITDSHSLNSTLGHRISDEVLLIQQTCHTIQKDWEGSESKNWVSSQSSTSSRLPNSSSSSSSSSSSHS